MKSRMQQLVLLATFLVQPAWSDPFPAGDDGGGPAATVPGTSDTTSKNVCRVYILGETQGMAMGLDIADGKGSLSRPCIPGSVSGDSLAESVKARIERSLAATPQDKDVDAARFVAKLAATTYPCRKTS